MPALSGLNDAEPLIIRRGNVHSKKTYLSASTTVTSADSSTWSTFLVPASSKRVWVIKWGPMHPQHFGLYDSTIFSNANLRKGWFEENDNALLTTIKVRLQKSIYSNICGCPIVCMFVCSYVCLCVITLFRDRALALGLGRHEGLVVNKNNTIFQCQLNHTLTYSILHK